MTHGHSKQINDIQLSKDMTALITASKDTTAKVSTTIESNNVTTTHEKRGIWLSVFYQPQASLHLTNFTSTVIKTADMYSLETCSRWPALGQAKKLKKKTFII